MNEFLFQYHEVKPTTWVYLSSLLMIGLYFKFSRFWSVRNLDLFLLILLAPGLLLVHYGKLHQWNAEPKVSQTGVLNRGAVMAGAAQQPSILPGAEGASEDSITEGGATEIAATQADMTQADRTQDAVAGGVVESPVVVDPSAEEAVALPLAVENLLDDSPNTWNLEYFGFIWLFAAAGILLVRLLMDPTMSRRPLLEPNLSGGGLAFIGCSLFIFLMANVVADSPDSPRFATTYVPAAGDEGYLFSSSRVGYPLLWTVPVNLAKTVVIASHLAVVLGIVAVGYRHFANMVMGMGAATLYLMLPYTALLTGRIDHVLPAAFLVWGIACYRQPLISGLLIGVAGGFVFFPLFLLPLWVSFYWHRGLMRFLSGWTLAIGAMVTVLLAVSAQPVHDLCLMFGLVSLTRSELTGIWDLGVGGWDSVYQWPIVAAYGVLSLSLILWPAQKNLGTLLSCSAALMVAAQFWHGQDGGIYMAWYLPMVLLTIFRPNLEDRVALAVLGERRARVRRSLSSVDLAA